jgi:hypothetical protein
MIRYDYIQLYVAVKFVTVKKLWHKYTYFFPGLYTCRYFAHISIQYQVVAGSAIGS